MDRIFSGVQPTGNLHIGNYLGAIKNFVELQNNTKQSTCYYCVVDLHAITVWQEPAKLKKDTLETVACFIAAGIDPKKSIIFNQSKVSTHSELAWILNCVCRMGWLNRMTQFKEKAGKNRENVSVGLFTYPVLMASDILAYKSNKVPVGEDQKQHLELARDIAKKFNNDFEVDFFPEVEPLIFGGATRVMSLRNGLNKMSKSDLNKRSINQKIGIKKRFPQLPDDIIQSSWSGIVSRTRNSSQIFEKIDNNIFVAGCYNGSGIGVGTLFGEQIAIKASNENTNEIETIEARNKPTWLPPDPILSLGVRARLIYERFRAKSEI